MGRPYTARQVLKAPPLPDWELDGLLDGDLPLLLVVDYAETRRDRVAPILRRLRLHRPNAPVRLVLVAREASDWWAELKTNAQLASVARLPSSQQASPPP